MGDLLEGRDPLAILEKYERSRVAGISYITADEYNGDIDLLKEICDRTELPVLRKDFIKEQKEVKKTAKYGCSSILLISSILGEELKEFVDLSLSLGLEPVVEVHDKQDVKLANSTDAPIIGINNRDISRLEKDDGTVTRTEFLAEHVRDDVILISESGIRGKADLDRAFKHVDAVLIGTLFMISEETERLVKEYVNFKR